MRYKESGGGVSAMSVLDELIARSYVQFLYSVVPPLRHCEWGNDLLW